MLRVLTIDYNLAIVFRKSEELIIFLSGRHVKLEKVDNFNTNYYVYGWVQFAIL